MKRSIGTHDGSFHADEVTACALLLFFDLVDKDKIIRTRDVEILNKCEYVCDVGGIYDPKIKRFDHHQSDYKGELSSAGMVWLYLKEKGVVDLLTYEFVNRSFLLGVDAHDNGKITPEIGVCSFSQVITNFVPPRYDAKEEVLQTAFFEALSFVEGHLSRLIERFRYMQLYQGKVKASMASYQKYLFFDEPMPWMDCFFEMDGENHPALFVIMPSQGHWKLRAIPPSMRDRMGVRVPMPKEWAGHLDEDLKKISRIPGAIFCHKSRFISVWETKEDAFKALQYILNQFESVVK